ncbi:zinc finger, C2H2 type family protein, putative (macronuclear) [Tetrahymena thermophila SB210]|uniref:Zinc finger, C2H2 type family protein, putative n=1 Tax=Tetrahymena thermophila (strain SB210) TaxID=312017 RepID=Q23J66_TETTS|nr:zinc finger, C2H2 type family protein, putative [Tetrahymena thermophila SB210]EAR96638.1 zinc finger, C2H2 type family protein, putative [Tetrahymena thermophila SB210]|eukprot:XP_001016883.1 zinc finger, C2H2 type family protein, putative [Tetrahymena thermophila SB210]
MKKNKDAQHGSILPFFACLCKKKEYKTLSSLSNHIKNEHEDMQTEFRESRGVPLGRVKKINKYQKILLQKLFEEQYNDNLKYSNQEIRDIFKENVGLVSEIVQKHQAQQFEDQLLRENIKLQPFWIKIKRNKVNMVMKKYYLAFLISTCNKNIVLQQEYKKDEVFQNLVNSFQDDNIGKNNYHQSLLSGVKLEQIKEENQ